MRKLAVTAIAISVLISSARVSSSQAIKSNDAEITIDRICKLIAREANTNGLPPEFFARLIWKESRFDAKAVSPAGAQGIAQFMPATAKAEGLNDPFDPEQAIPASARLLNKLRVQIGNLGLAAAAYNAGEGRVDKWLRKGGVLPIETENYVLDITGEPADNFFEPSRQIKQRPLEKNMSFFEACLRLPVIKTRSDPMAVALTMPWSIQVAGNYKRSIAQRSWRRIKSRYASTLNGLPMAISRSRTAIGRRGIYTVRIGAASRAKANRVCNALRTNGGSCIVMKN